MLLIIECRLEDKDLSVILKDDTEGLVVKISEKSKAARRVVLSVPLSGLDELKKAITDAQKAARGKGSAAKAAAPAPAAAAPAAAK